jgi:hypothetical protein
MRLLRYVASDAMFPSCASQLVRGGIVGSFQLVDGLGLLAGTMRGFRHRSSVLRHRWLPVSTG